MKNFHWKEYWHLLKIRLMSAYPYLTEDDVRYQKGGEEKLMKRLQAKMNLSYDQLNEILFLLLIEAKEEPEEDEKEVEALIAELEKDLEENKDYYAHIFK